MKKKLFSFARRLFTPELKRLAIHFAVLFLAGLLMEQRPTPEALMNFASAAVLQILSAVDLL